MLIAMCTIFAGCSKSDVGENNQENQVIEKTEKTEEIEQIRKAEINDYLTVRSITCGASDNVFTDTRYEYYDNGAYKSLKMELPLSGFESGHIFVDYERPLCPGVIVIGKTYGNKVGESTITDNGYHEVIYDSEWRKIYEASFEPNSSKPTEINTYTYDDKGNLTEHTWEGESWYMDTKYEYDEYNVMISKDEEIVTSKNRRITYYTYGYEYDDDGLPLIRYEYISGKKNTTTKIYRDNAGLICKEEITDSKGSVSYNEYERYSKAEYIDKFSTVEETVEDPINDAVDSSELFERILAGKYEVTFTDLSSSDGSILVSRETPADYNNNAKYSIGGRGFSTFYDTNCIEANTAKDSWIFESYGTFYEIVIGIDDVCYIYYSKSREGLTETRGRCCGSFSIPKNHEFQEVLDNSMDYDDYNCFDDYFDDYDGFLSPGEAANDITVENFEQKVSLRPGNSEVTDYAMEEFKKETDESGSPYVFKYKYIGECSDGFYYYNGEGLTFNVYRITYYKDGHQGIYFMPLNVGENMVWEFCENYYELAYKWTQY